MLSTLSLLYHALHKDVNTSGMFILSYLLFLLAPLITYLVSKIQLFSPQSENYVVENLPLPAEYDRLLKTEYLEIYANHTLVLVVVISASLLMFLHIMYAMTAFWGGIPYVQAQHQLSVGSSHMSNSYKTAGSTRSSWIGDQVSYNRDSLDGRASLAPANLFSRSRFSTPIDGDLELQVLPRAISGPRRVPVSPGPNGRGAAGEDSDDDNWKTVYCEEWTSGKDIHGAEEAVEHDISWI